MMTKSLDLNHQFLTSFSFACVQEFRAALTVPAGGTTSHVPSAHLESVPASRPNGSVTETMIVGTTAMRMDAVSFCLNIHLKLV